MPDEHKYTAYTLAAAAFIHMHAAKGEVIYTDVDPDSTFNIPGSVYELDLNNDGLVDFSILFTSSVFYDFYYGYNARYVKRGVFASPQNGNAIAASSAGGGAFVYPYQLNFGVEVGPYAFSPGSFFDNFLQDELQTLQYIYHRTLLFSAYYSIVQEIRDAGWLSPWAGEFLGLQLNAFDQTHYGWLRLSMYVDSEIPYFKIKDYAYENKSGIPITTFIAPTSIQAEPESEIVIFSSGTMVYITLPDIPANSCDIEIYDLGGKLIHQEQTTAQKTTISLSHIPAGNYIIRCSDTQNETSKQLFINP